jgi:hypothetical protein
MDTARPQATLDDFEAATFAEDEAGNGNADVFECDFRVAMGSVIIAVDREHTFHGNPGGVGRNEDDGVLLVGVGGIWVTLGHDNVDFASWVTSSAAPPFLGESVA